VPDLEWVAEGAERIPDREDLAYVMRIFLIGITPAFCYQSFVSGLPSEQVKQVWRSKITVRIVLDLCRSKMGIFPIIH
jgi:hypothetical protein